MNYIRNFIFGIRRFLCESKDTYIYLEGRENRIKHLLKKTVRGIRLEITLLGKIF